MTSDVSSAGGSFAKRGHAQEEKYFQSLNKEQLNKFSEAIHKKELNSLLKILPHNHNLSSEQIHNILVWKHKDFL